VAVLLGKVFKRFQWNAYNAKDPAGGTQVCAVLRVGESCHRANAVWTPILKA
jgi:hypothetical protein